MTNLSTKILAEIEKEHIVPTPRWHFLLKNYVFWGLFAISVLLGSLAFSVIADMKDSGDWDLLGHVQGNLWASAVMLLPYFWFFFLLAFASIAYYNWHHTRKGYLLKRRWIFLGSIASSIFLGSFFYAFGWGGKVDRLMVETMPFYDESKQKAREELWLQPENGLLMGKIVEINDDEQTLVIEDEKGQNWVIDNVEKSIKDKKVQSSKKKGKVLKFIGSKRGEKNFEAEEIRKCDDCDCDEDDNCFRPTGPDLDRHEDAREEKEGD